MNKGIISIAGGKGGTGKTFFTVNFGISLASMGYDVIVIDGDFGGPDVHNFLSVERPDFSLTDFFLKEKKNLEDIIVETKIKNLRLIACGASVYGLANLEYAKKMSLFEKIKKLNYDFTLIDLGAGTHFNTVDFFNLSNEGILVTTTDSMSRQDALIFLKTALYRKIVQTIKKNQDVWWAINEHIKQEKKKSFNIDTILKWVIENSSELVDELRELLLNYKPKFILNKTRNINLIPIIQSITVSARKHLQIDLEYLGNIRFDSNIEKSLENKEIFISNYPHSGAAKDIFNISSNNFPPKSVSFKKITNLIKKIQKT